VTEGVTSDTEANTQPIVDASSTGDVTSDAEGKTQPLVDVPGLHAALALHRSREPHNLFLFEDNSLDRARQVTSPFFID
jgi:hypothetical protein